MQSQFVKILVDNHVIYSHFFEREREKNIHQLPPVLTLTRDRTHNLDMYPDWESNL